MDTLRCWFLDWTGLAGLSSREPIGDPLDLARKTVERVAWFGLFASGPAVEVFLPDLNPNQKLAIYGLIAVFALIAAHLVVTAREPVPDADGAPAGERYRYSSTDRWIARGGVVVPLVLVVIGLIPAPAEPEDCALDATVGWTGGPAQPLLLALHAGAEAGRYPVYAGRPIAFSVPADHARHFELTLVWSDGTTSSFETFGACNAVTARASSDGRATSTSRFARRAAAIAVAALAGAAVLGLATSAAAETFVIGRVVDAVSRQPIAGAEVSVRRGGEVLGGSITSGLDGTFRVPFDPPAATGVATLTLAATAPGFDGRGIDFQVVDGAVRDLVDATLYPAGILACRDLSRRSVVVGQFLAPVGQTWPDLPDRLAFKLDFGLGPLVQTVAMSRDHTPTFIACGAIKANRTTGASFAKALGADALVAGTIAGSAPTFVVTTYVADGHGFFAAPPTVRSADVNLDDPMEGPLSSDTYVAVLAAVAAGLAGQGDCVGALTVLNATAQATLTAAPYIADLRSRCEANVPNAGLLPDT